VLCSDKVSYDSRATVKDYIPVINVAHHIRFIDKEAYDECDHDGPSYVFAMVYTIVYMGIGLWLFLAFLAHK